MTDHGDQRPILDPTPSPGLKLRDLILAQMEAAYVIERDAKTIAALTKMEVDQAHLRLAKALDASRMLLESLVAEWPQHKALIQSHRRQFK